MSENHQWVLRPNGKLLSAGEFPQALLYGYSVFTTFKIPIEKRWLSSHLDRLQSNAAALGLCFPWEQGEIIRVLESLKIPPGQVVRLTVIPSTKTLSEFFQDTEKALPTELYVSVTPYRPNPKIGEGLTLKTVLYQKPLPWVKHGNLLESFLLKRQAQQAGFDEVLWVSSSGVITEATTANFFGFKDKTLYTPLPERDGCLPGMTRAQVLEQAAAQGWQIDLNEPMTLPFVESLDGAFLTNAVQGIIPIQRINQTTFQHIALPSFWE